MHITGRKAVSAILGAFGCCLWLAAEAGSAAAPELQKLYALLVIDTQANLGESVRVDGERMKQLLQAGIPKERLHITVLTDKDVTASKVAAYYRNLKVTSADVLLFYYTGHGATVTDKGHYLVFQDAKTPSLLRSELRALMQEKQAGLTVLLTDCCSTRIKVDGKTTDRKLADQPPPAAKELKPVFRNLLFQHRGVVDITAASGNTAFADDRNGGLFTLALGGVLLPKQPLQFDGNKDGFVSWKEFFPSLRQETENISTHWIKAVRQQPNNKLKIDQSTQRPQAFELTEATTTATSLTIRNASADPLRYQFRWGGVGAFETAVLKAQEARVHTLPGGKAAKEIPTLEVKPDSGDSVQLKAGKSYRYSGSAKKNRSLLDDDDDDPAKP